MFKFSYIENIIIFILLISLAMDPTGEFYKLKYFSTFITSIYFFGFIIFLGKKLALNQIQLLYIGMATIIITLYGIAITSLHTSILKISDTAYLGFSFFVLLLLPVLIVDKEQFQKALIFSIRVFSAFILIVFLSFLYDEDQAKIAQFFIDKQTLLFSFREYSGVRTYYLYFTASPLLIFLVVYDSYQLIRKFKMNRFIKFLLSTLAIILSGTRFNMLIGIFTFPIMFFVLRASTKNIFRYSLIAFASIIIFLNISMFNSFFDANETSNSAKQGYLSGYLKIFSDPINLMFGQGFDAHKWSADFSNMLFKSGNEGTRTELTFLELIRVYGIIIGMATIGMLALIPHIIYKYNKGNSWLVFATLLYLLSAVFNPYLFSTNGVIFILLFLNSIKMDNTNESLIKWTL